MKKSTVLALGCGVLMLLTISVGCGGLIFFGWGMFKEMDDATDSFLAKLGSGDTAGAYQAGSASLRQAQTLEEFTASVKKMGLDGYVSSNWSSRKFVNDAGTVEGTIATKTGVIAVTVSLVKEGGVWKVSGIQPTGTGGTTSTKPGTRPVPTDDEMKKLVQRTLTQFDAAAKAGDFSKLRAETATPFQKEFTTEQLNEDFRTFIEQKYDMKDVAKEPPVFDSTPGVNDQGVLVLTGYTTTEKGKVSFKLKYTYEHPSWKIIAIFIKYNPNE